MSRSTQFIEEGDIGIEFEFPSSQKESNKLLNSLSNKLKGFQIVHDGSSETAFPSFRGVPITAQGDNMLKLTKIFSARSLGISTAGGEIISPILPGVKNGWQEAIASLCDVFSRENTAPELAYRCSIHVHYNLGNSVKLQVLKNLVLLALRYEPYMYMISGFGQPNRCTKNKYTFARPILFPPCYGYETNTGHTYYPIFSVDALLNAKTKEDFFNLLYNSPYVFAQGNKYIPQRYMGLNFYSILVRNSLEFRYANVTINPQWIITWIKFCEAFVEHAKYSQNLTKQVTGLNDTTKDGFIECIQELGISTPYSYILLDLFDRATPLNWEDHQLITHATVHSFNPKTLGVSAVEKKPLIADNLNVRDLSSQISRILRQDDSVPEVRSYNTDIFVIQNISQYERDYTLFEQEYGVPRFHGTIDKIHYIKRLILEDKLIFFYPLLDLSETRRFSYSEGEAEYKIYLSLERRDVLRVKISNSAQIVVVDTMLPLQRLQNSNFCYFDHFKRLFIREI